MNTDYKNSDLNILLNDLSQAELSVQELKYNHSITPLQNPQEIKSAKKTVARLKTEIRKREIISTGNLNRDKLKARRRKQ